MDSNLSDLTMEQLKAELASLDSKYRFELKSSITINDNRQLQTQIVNYSRFLLCAWNIYGDIRNGKYKYNPNVNSFRNARTFTGFLKLNVRFNSLIISYWNYMNPLKNDISRSILPFFYTIDKEVINDFIDTFCYYCFPFLHFYFSLADYIHLAHNSIQTVYGMMNNEYGQIIFGKMCSVFFAGFPQISDAFFEFFLYKYFDVKSIDIDDILSYVFPKMPAVLTKYHINIIKLMKQYPKLFFKYILEDVLFRNLDLILTNDSTKIRYTKVNLDKLRTEISDYLKNQKDTNYDKANFYMDILLEDSGTEVFLPETTKAYIQGCQNCCTLKEFKLLTYLFNFAKPELNLKINTNEIIELSPELGINKNRLTKENIQTIENLLFQINTSFSIIAQDPYEHNTDDSYIKKLVEDLWSSRIPYSYFLNYDSKWPISKDLLELINSIRASGNERIVIEDMIGFLKNHQQKIMTHINSIYDHQLYEQFYSTLINYSKTYIKFIGVYIFNNLSFHESSIFQKFENAPKNVLNLFMPYITLCIAQQIADTKEYNAYILQSGANEEVDSYLLFKEFVITDNKYGLSNRFLIDSLNACGNSLFVDQYFVILDVLRHLYDRISYIEKDPMVCKEKMLMHFLHLYQETKAKWVFTFYVIYSKLMINQSIHSPNLTNQLKIIEPEYEMLLNYLDEIFKYEVFPVCPKAESCFIAFLSAPI